MKIYTYKSANSKSAKNFKRFFSLALSLLVVLQMAPGAFAVNYANAQVSEPDPYGGVPQVHVNICHTGNGTNFASIPPSITATGGQIDLSGGHLNHNEDIIPPFHFDDNGTILYYAGQNWTIDNQTIWNGGNCDGVVIPPAETCSDGIQNQDETGVDTGGLCTPPPVPSCTDGIQNQNETGIDSGGVCTITAETCSDGIQNQNETGIDTGGECSVPSTDATLQITKIVCNTESDLPNWSDDSITVDANTGTNFLLTHPNCHLAEGWHFQTVERVGGLPQNVVDPGGDHVDVAPNPWTLLSTATNINGVLTTTFDVTNVWHVLVREVLKDNFVPFSSTYGGNQGNDVSAELYCSTTTTDQGYKITGYDNFDSIDNPVAGQTYYCVAFNAPKTEITTQSTTGSITVHKVVINDNGGSTATSSFQFLINGLNPTNFEADGANDLSLAPGVYTITEVAASGYTASFTSSCTNFQIVAGQNSPTCVVTNNDIAEDSHQELCTDTEANNQGEELPCTYNDNGGDNGGDDSTTTTHRHHSGGGGIVLGDSTTQGEVLGATFEPGLPNTGNGPISTTSDVSRNLAILFAGLITLIGLNLASFRALKVLK